jgi:membrane fusion protein, multidrug efflux system
METVMHRQRLILVLASAVLIAGGCGRPSAPPAAAARPTGPVEVGVATVHPERVVLTTELPGRTTPYLIADVRPQVNGIIQERRFAEGSTVQAGTVLYQIDPAPYRATLEQAKASLALAEAALPPARSRAERLKSLVEIRAVGQQDYDDAAATLLKAEATVQAARAAVESAQINLSYTPLKAPISGRTGKSSVTPGALVSAYQGTPLVTIQQLDPIYVDVTQSSADLLRLRRSLESGQVKKTGAIESKVKLLLEDGSAYPREGRLQFRDVTVDPTTGSVVLRLVFPNPDAVLLPGMFVRALVEEGVQEQAMLVPQQGVARDVKGNTTAMVVDGTGKIVVRPITVTRAIGSRWLVTSGLVDGDQVIVDGLQRSRAGMTVKAVPYVAAGASADRATAAPAK